MSITILHLTDIHFKLNKDDNWILQRSNEIYKACQSVINTGDNIIIVVSGDIADSGKSEEYEYAKDFFDKLKTNFESLSNNFVQVLLVAGNHDCNFVDDDNNIIRNRILNTLDMNNDVDKATIDFMMIVQKDFCNFSKRYNASFGDIYTNYVVEFEDKKILFLMFNSAWMSTKNEKAGSLFIPQNIFDEINAADFDCVISIMHHPYSWFHPDNGNRFKSYLKKTTDILILGHEHVNDKYKLESEECNYRIFKGKELQGYDPKKDCGFSIYKFDEIIENIKTYDFVWNADQEKFILFNNNQSMFRRNIFCTKYCIYPSQKFMEKMNDPGVIINHFKKDNIKLFDIYCWPILEVIDNGEFSVIEQKKISEKIFDKLLESNINFVVGEASTGKTSMAKMLFKKYIEINKCCLFCDGSELKTHNKDNLWIEIEKIFVSEYSEDCIDGFRQLNDGRILIIDNLNNIPYMDRRRGKIILYLLEKFSNIIAFSDNTMDLQLILTEIKDYKVSEYEILYFGNQKRREFIEKWYYIDDEFGRKSIEINNKIDLACNKINEILNVSGGGIIPAAPIYLISLLQNLDVAPSSFSGSQYGFLYESLIKKSLSNITDRYRDAGDINIDINILAFLAFSMLKNNANNFAAEDLDNIVKAFTKEKKVAVNNDSILKKMLHAKIFEEDGTNTYKFKYPYMFYYFSGYYIAYNIKEQDVKEMIEYMSSRLYNEKFGNIIIFVCHFANNIDIIEDILIVAYTTLDQYEPFDFDKHTIIFERANKVIEQLLIPDVGEEEDVKKNIEHELIIKDNAGIQDGTIHESDDKIIDEDLDDGIEKDLQSAIAGLRTIDVLGQILKNYPGDIDGIIKVKIIDEIHKLGMRIIEAWMTAIGIMEKEFISFLLEKLKEQNNMKTKNDIVMETKTFISSLIAGMIRGMINKIAKALSNKTLMPAIEESFIDTNIVSQNLVIQDLKFNIIKIPNEQEAIKLADWLRNNIKNEFAYTVLRAVIAYYLCHNNCGYKMRNRLCQKFELRSEKALVVNTKNSIFN